MSLVFQGVDLKRYLKSFQLAGGGGWQVLVWVEGRARLASHPAEVTQLVARIRATGIDLLPDAEVSLCDEQGVIWLMPIRDHLGTTLASVVVASDAVAFDDRWLESVRQITWFLEHDTRVNLELAEMADELNRRHEELNLIYSTNNDKDEDQDEQEALQEMLDHIRDHMDAELVLLSVPERRVWVSSIGDVGRPFLERLTSADAESVTSRWMQAHGEPLVINAPNDEVAQEIGFSPPFRTIVVPVRDEREDMIGGLAFCRSFDKPRLTNSDKNLLMTLGARISKLIQTHFDSLTGLPRRGRFERLLKRAMHEKEGRSGRVTLVHINVDGLSALNEHFGVLAGDGALRVVASQLLKAARKSDIVGRIGGDEFGLALIGCSERVAMRKLHMLQDNLARQPYIAGRARQILRFSAGVVETDPATSHMEAMTKAKVVCNIAKERGGNTIEAYGSTEQRVSQRKEEVRILNDLRRAAEDDRFVLYAQEIRATGGDDPSPHFEVLVRMLDEDGGIVPPNDFIPIAEKHNMMPMLDRWVVAHALDAVRASGVLDRFPGTVVSVNLSGQSFTSGGVVEELERIIRDTSVPPANICFEVTETAAIADMAAAELHIRRIRKLGCRFALDDFGAGLSSFSYLRALPVDYVKIDGSFVKDMCRDRTAAVMVEAIHNVSASMGLKTVAEYVEDEQILIALQSLGVNFAQGYGIGRPMPLEEFLASCVATPVRAHG